MSPIHDQVEAAHGGSLLARVDLRNEVHRMLESGDAGRSEIDRFLREGSPRDWITFDESMRAFWYGENHTPTPWWRRAWQTLRPRAERIDLLALGLASMDRDGRVREAAIRQIATEEDSVAGQFLALRTTDWVEQVATLAITTLTKRLATDPETVISSAPLLFALSDRHRRSGIDRLVLECAAANRFVRAKLMASPDRRTRRRVIDDEGVRSAASLDELVGLAKSDPDTLVASAAGVEAVSRVEGSESTNEVLGTLLSGPALVRRAVLDALADRTVGRSTAERYLFDRSPAVRGAAQRAYRRFEGDPAAAYRAAFERGEHVPIVVSELALVGSSGDHSLILQALRSEDAATRRAAVNAVKWIAPERLVELLAPLLSDPSAGVTSAAVTRLGKAARDLDGGMLLDLAKSPRAHNRRAAYRLMRRRAPWERVEADLLALSDVDDHVRRDALLDVRSWLHRGAASARRADLPTRRRLSQRLDAVEHLLRRDDAAAIRFHAGLREQDLHGQEVIRGSE